MINGIGLVICGANLWIISLSVRDSLTKINSKFSKYRRPPWINFVDHDEVAPPILPLSERPTLKPLPAASLAMPAPLIPPPIINISNLSSIVIT